MEAYSITRERLSLDSDRTYYTSQGSFGDVHKAVLFSEGAEPHSSCTVAVKMLRVAENTDPATIKRVSNDSCLPSFKRPSLTLFRGLLESFSFYQKCNIQI